MEDLTFISHLEASIKEGIKWVVFEPNNENLWTRVRQSITNFLFNVWREGRFVGATPEEAFFVKCDRSTMTQDDIDNGLLVCMIGIATEIPAEFSTFRIEQVTANHI
jgi:phage tail sheath protein FI